MLSRAFFRQGCKLSHRPLASRPFLAPQFSRSKFSLADEIMKDKVEEEAKSSGKGGEEPPPKGPRPLGKWEKIGYSFVGATFVGGLLMNAIIFSLPDRDEEGQNIPDEFSELPFPSQYYKRLSNKIFKTKKDLEEPFSDKLLPEPLQKPYYQPKYTVFLELTGLLVHATWTHKHGWRFLKRPGVDIFLSQVGYPQFELVVYTTENAMTFFPIIDGLDPEHQHIMHRLFRDATRYHNGHHIKDLNSVNRDPKRVIVVDWNENSVQLQPENALLLKKWQGDTSDRSLIVLAQLLQTIRNSDVDDVRDVLRYYKQFDDPVEAFRENQRRLQDELQVQEEKRIKELEQRKTTILPSLSSSFKPWGR